MIYDVVTSSAVRYVVLGCGAVGGTVAAGLVRDGHDVLACDADPAVVEAIGARGLRITGPVENFTVALPAVTPGDLPDRLDCPVLVAVKAHHTAAAAELLAGRMHGGGFAVSLQNGLTTPILAAAVGPERVVAAVVNFGADMTEPGVVLRGNRATFMVGELDGRLSARARALAADIAGAVATRDILGYAWAKLAYGAVLAATAVSDLPIAEVLAEPAYRPLLTELARQVAAQAPVAPMPLDGFDAGDLPGSLDRLAAFNRASAKTHTGIYRDLAILHRPTEVPAILGDLTGSLPPLVVDLVRAIERGQRSCSRGNLDLLAACERAERLGRPLNAVVCVIGAPERAPGGPLAGRHVAVKDIIEVAGVPTRCGSPASSPEPASADAAVVARLRAAGAEVFATSQCLEYAAGFAHPQVGDTRNPRDPARTSGGSSGGSAALVAAGACALALGTDTGGSIRIPAAYCGITGLKPTYGLLPVAGVFPLSPACDHVGTLTAAVAGAADLLAALADPGALAPPPAGGGGGSAERKPGGREARGRERQGARGAGKAESPPASWPRSSPIPRSRRRCTGRSPRRWPCWRRPAGGCGRSPRRGWRGCRSGRTRSPSSSPRRRRRCTGAATGAGMPRAPAPCSITVRPSPAISTTLHYDSARSCPPRSRQACPGWMCWPAPRSAIRPRNRTRRSGPARTRRSPASPARTTSPATRRSPSRCPVPGCRSACSWPGGAAPTWPCFGPRRRPRNCFRARERTDPCHPRCCGARSAWPAWTFP